MRRILEEELTHWKNSKNRKPLILRGARQVGKSYLAEYFGQKYYENTVVINFEFERKYIKSFETLDPRKIINSLSLSSGQAINPHNTLLFLDEIQECPNAILALRYFKEKMPELHIIAAGSLLEFVLNEGKFRLPVGRVQSLYMKPCSFKEFLTASNQQGLVDYLEAVTLETKVEPAIHDTLLEKIRTYMVLGGMPEVISSYLDVNDFYQAQVMQSSLMEYYQKDFGKYDNVKPEYLRQIFDKAPGLVAKQFKYVDVAPDIQSRELKPALRALVDAGLVYSVYHTSASSLPFSATANRRKFKLLFLDVGLVNFACDLDASVLLNKNIILQNRGILAEQFVGQELLAYNLPYRASELYYWEREKRGSSAEVDYLIQVGEKIFPVEVKSGSTGRLKSLQIFIDEKDTQFGIRISQHQFSFDKRILSVPLYMVSELSRLVSLV